MAVICKLFVRSNRSLVVTPTASFHISLGQRPRNTPGKPIERQRRDSSSIPNIFFIEFEIIFIQHFAIFFLKSFRAVMRLLIVYVMN